MSLLKVIVCLATVEAFLAPATQRPAVLMQAAKIAAKDVSALRKASGARQRTHHGGALNVLLTAVVKMSGGRGRV
jgi:hypothetical protein